MDKMDKTIAAMTAAVAIPLAATAMVLEIKSRKLGKRMNGRKDVIDLLQKAKGASTEEESDEFLVNALALLDKVDPKKFKEIFGK